MGVRLAIETIEDDGTRVAVVLEFDQPRIVLGRGASADVVLPHASVSAVHASLRSNTSGYAIVDEASTNGTRAGGVRLVPERPRGLRSGDTLVIGPYTLTISLGIPVAHAASADDATAAARRLVELDAAESDARVLVFVTGTRAGERLVLPTTGTWVIGRAEDADVCIDDAESSRKHAELTLDADGAVVGDAGSKNGVILNGRSVRSRRLRDGDELTVGVTIIAYEDARDRAVSAVASEVEDGPEALERSTEAHAAPVIEPATEESDDAHVELESTGDRPVEFARRPADDERWGDRLVFGLALGVLALSVVAMVWIFGNF